MLFELKTLKKWVLYFTCYSNKFVSSDRIRKMRTEYSCRKFITISNRVLRLSNYSVSLGACNWVTAWRELTVNESLNYLVHLYLVSIIIIIIITITIVIVILIFLHRSLRDYPDASIPSRTGRKEVVVKLQDAKLTWCLIPLDERWYRNPWGKSFRPGAGAGAHAGLWPLFLSCVG